MSPKEFACGVSAVVLSLSLLPFAARAQTQLPILQVGKPKPIKRTAAAKPSPRSGVSHASNANGASNAAPVAGEGSGLGLANNNGTDIGPGANGQICADGICNNPTSYSAPVESLGTKVNTPVMNTPLATKTVTHQMLEDQQVITLDQALRDVSGVSVTGGGAIGNGTSFGQVTIRGFSTNAYYRDGIRIDNFGATNIGVAGVEFANVESVEVLKGPAAILYGAVEPGGIVNLNMKQPLETPAYSVQQQIGSWAAYRTTMDATGPLAANKELLYRLTASYENDGSFQTYGYTRNLMFNPVLKWNVDNNTWVKFDTQYQENRLNQVYNVIPFFNSVSPLWLGRGYNYNAPSPLSQPTLFSELSAAHNFDNGWAVKATTFLQSENYFQATNLPIGISDCISGPLAPICGFIGSPFVAGNTSLLEYSQPVKNRQEEYATVVDITGHFDTGELKHTLLLGSDYYRYNFRGELLAPLNLGTLSLFGAPAQLPTFATNLFPLLASAQQADNVGAYVQDQIDLPYGFHVLAGARYQYISSRSQATNTIPGSLDTLSVPALANEGITTTQRVTPRAGLTWRPLEWVSFYGNYVEALSPNYTGSLVINTNQPPPPSAGQQEEAGVKFELLDKKLQISADYYHLIKTNIPVGIPNRPTFVELVGEGRSQGPELDIQGELLPGWKVNLAYANTDVIVTKGIAGASSATPAVGAPFPYVPRNQATLASNYEFRDGALRGLKFGARYDYTGLLPFYHYDNSGNYIYGSSTPSYGLVGLFAAYETEYNGLKIKAQLNVDNLLDTSYFTNGGFGWIPGFLPGFAAPTISQGWGLNNLNVIGAPRTFRGLIRVAF
ncbi:TonB-dependent siderophore receptor [Methylocystis bryophila]|nr:TonB-dependent siderophore receptor [Methylocystis bryophila]BDV37059.1 ferrichrome-iron receptor [Methylocystis bryophila]